MSILGSNCIKSFCVRRRSKFCDHLKSTYPSAFAFGLVLLRKEVIQPHLPVRLPCYDLVPVTNHTFADALLAVRQPTSGTTNFGDLTGGVYKTRERIHPIVADTGLLTIPASCRRVAACNLNWGRL